MLTFTVVWDTPSGRFGWTRIEECTDVEEAASFWLTERDAGRLDVPSDAQISHVRPA